MITGRYETDILQVIVLIHHNNDRLDMVKKYLFFVYG